MVSLWYLKYRGTGFGEMLGTPAFFSSMFMLESLFLMLCPAPYSMLHQLNPKMLDLRRSLSYTSKQM
jgi:hypothetical protein